MPFYNTYNDSTNFVISFTENPEMDFCVFAKGYAQTASFIAESLLNKSRFSDYEAYPVVFLYRHAFELYLKGLYFKAYRICLFNDFPPITCSFIYKHKLKPLADTLQKICKFLYPADQELLGITQKIIIFADEFECIDGDSFSYRYPIDKKGSYPTSCNQLLNLRSLHISMKTLLGKIEIIDFGFDIDVSKAQEVYDILQNTQSVFACEKDNGY